MFPMSFKEDFSGNAWFQQEDREYKLNHGVAGAHASIAFQCEDCWVLNLEHRLPVPGRDDALLMFIRRANLDAIAGRSPSTSTSHSDEVKRIVRNCKLIGKTPNIPPRGPMPIADQSGMGIAIDMLLNSVTAKSRIKGQAFVQYGTMRKVRATYTTGWESSPQGIAEGTSFNKGMGQGSTLTTCPTQQKWFTMFSLGMETRMGYATKADRALHINIILRLLELVIEEASMSSDLVESELYKFGAAIVAAICGSLRGPEVFKMDLAGLRAHIHLG